LLKKREEQQKAELDEQERQHHRKVRFQYGLAANGLPVDVKLVESLCTMGFDKTLAVEALRQSSNKQEQSITLLTQNRDLLISALPPDLRMQHMEVAPELIARVCSVGFTEAQAKTALLSHECNVERAVDSLVRAAQRSPSVPESNMSGEDVDDEDQGEEEQEEPLPPPLPLPPLDPAIVKLQEERRLKRQIEDELLGAVPADEEDYFDVDVTELNKVTEEYGSLLAKAK